MTQKTIPEQTIKPNELVEGEQTENNEVQREQAQGFSLTAEFVANSENKDFEIMNYKTLLVKDLDNPTEKKEKLILKIVFGSDKLEADWFINRTSQKVIMNKKGPFYKNWVGFKGELEALDQMVAGKKKKVIFIKE
jgi:hypothetical protein